MLAPLKLQQGCPALGWDYCSSSRVAKSRQSTQQQQQAGVFSQGGACDFIRGIYYIHVDTTTLQQRKGKELKTHEPTNWRGRAVTFLSWGIPAAAAGARTHAVHDFSAPFSSIMLSRWPQTNSRPNGFVLPHHQHKQQQRKQACIRIVEQIKLLFYCKMKQLCHVYERNRHIIRGVATDDITTDFQEIGLNKGE